MTLVKHTFLVLSCATLLFTVACKKEEKTVTPVEVIFKKEYLFFQMLENVLFI